MEKEEKQEEKKDEKFIDTVMKEGKLDNRDKFTLIAEILRQLIDDFAQQKEENKNSFSQVFNKIAQQKEEDKTRDKKIDDLNISLNIMSQINKQRDIQYNLKIDKVNKKMQLLINSFRSLFMRKFANLILEQIYLKYAEDLGKGNIQVGKKDHNIIALLPKSKRKYRRDYEQINLIIDFLRFIWKKCSDIIHLQKNNFTLRAELLYEYLKSSGISSDEINAKEGIQINKLIGLIFNEQESKKSKRNKSEIKNNPLENAIKKLLKKKESLILLIKM